ncbi:MAG: Fe2+-dependent dioxygenase [gamma proteobacterium symbiont of Ctena orbiculata]|uniref:Fe2+-dependent dioxygenase n=1 Tax=Candidatus Thiodiazotropha taylori TaxID=2792791 RepID=A0A944M7C3_9GAMM|nr:Fe2+-dependent dioxygenase [Candidatus Thiodiazotropha taylori]PUB83845.1 MAG: Fe2+-dependent dioxygenase [gamma proteobacterium symbiont of Ctena orbiculata]MBT2988450.1 Fe2+-dependent dioxygenase [Candidatus Thiodiazotropha taylori]MBT2997357.1 Fe2+-dependent dioxygenase [Candidatus Thiodiazotropha taylori]MBT3000933.1 Fe2+-dependent dioxygenase [Candidatus Thiodiazotropha taylori]
MLVEIEDLLMQPQLQKIDEVLARAEFVDGKLTAGKAAQRVKNNEELKGEQKQMELLIRILTSAMGNNPIFRSAVLPYRMADPIFARYQSGMTYGDHVDDPLMGLSGQRFRSDVSMTIFLREPESYQGGELVVRTTFGEKRVKLRAGSAVIYPSSSLHHVAEVTEGERMVALAWIQSYVRDPARRELLYELDLAREHLLATAPEAETTGLVDKSYANLLRMWGDV